MTTLARHCLSAFVIKPRAAREGGCSRMLGGEVRLRRGFGRVLFPRRVLLMVLLSCGALLGLGVAAASASVTHHLEFSFNGSGAPSGKFVQPEGVAFDQASGDVYVADASKEVVDKYTPSGAYAGVEITGASTPAGSFNFFQGVTAGVAVDNSGGVNAGDVYVADEHHSVVDRFGPTGTYLGQISVPSGNFFASGPSGVAVDASGRVFVADNFNPVVDEFDSSGSLIHQITASNSGTPSNSNGIGFPTAIALDPQGDLFVVNTANDLVNEFSPSGTWVATIDRTSGSASQGGLAVDPGRGSDLYVYNDGSGISEFDRSGAFVDSFGSGTLGSDAVPGLAVLGSSGEVYAADYSSGLVDVFGAAITIPDVTTGEASGIQPTAATLSGTVNPDGTTLNGTPDGCRFEYVDAAHYDPSASDPYGAGQTAACASTPSGSSAVPVSTAISSLSPNTTYHFRLEASNTATGGDAVYGSDQSFTTTGPPTITGSAAVDVTGSSATLEAAVNPHGFDAQVYFEYGTSSSYGSSTAVTDVGSGTSLQTMAVTVAGLTPGTAYHFRVVAASAAAPSGVDGPDQTFTTTAPGSCPNSQLRTGYSAHLPDCRAYEQVTPVDKGSGGPLVFPESSMVGDVVAVDGSRIGWTSPLPLPGALSPGGYYLSSRGADGWSSREQTPPQSMENGLGCGQMPAIDAYSPNLENQVLGDGAGQLDGTGCGQDDPALVPGEPQGVQNLFLRDAGGAYQLVSPNPVAGPPWDAVLDGSSADLSHIVFESVAQLTPDAPPFAGNNGHEVGHQNVYDWSAGSLHLVNVMPGGGLAGPCNASEGCIASADFPGQFHAVSADGSRIYFQAWGGGQSIDGIVGLFVREDDSTTVQVDASHGPGPGGGGRFQIASSDGSQVFFTDDASAGLTGDTVPGSGQNLYHYNLASGELTDLTPVANADVGMHATGVGVVGASDDGSHVYFVAGAALAGGATPGQPNLYLWHAGTTTFVATLDGATTSHDRCNWGPGESCPIADVSSDGRYVAFDSDKSLTGVDTAGFTQVYLYDASSGQLTCASCEPTGAPSTASASMSTPMPNQVGISSTTSYSGRAGSVPRNLTVAPDGTPRVFFETTEALLPADSNGKQDVYEYEDGQLHLISSGTSDADSVFVDASASGDDVFFATREQLLPSDTDTAYDIYDARVGGGFPSTPSTAPCAGDACKGPLGAPPALPAAASVTFTGPGNPSSTSGPSVAEAKVLSKVVRGSAFFVRVRVPGPGRVTVTGTSVNAVARSVPRAGAYSIRVGLTKAAERALAGRHKLRLRLRVSYAPPGAPSSAGTVSLTVEPALPQRARHTRRSSRNQGGGK